MINCGITGSSGVLGSELVKKYEKKINFIKYNGDITKKKILKKWFDRNNFDIFIHLAAIVPSRLVDKNYKFAKKINVVGTKNIAELALVKKKLSWFFFSSTSHVYKNKINKINENSSLCPYTKYGQTKLNAEKLLIKKFKKSKIRLCIGRIFSFTSPRQNLSFFIPNVVYKIKKNKLNFSNINHFRDFISINDICRAIIFLSKIKYRGIINICSGKQRNLEYIVKFFAKKFKKKITIKNKNLSTHIVGNNYKLKKLGWQPRDKFKDIINAF